MPEIIPFRGILYNQSRIKSLAKVVTPPYDVISPQQQSKYYRKNKYNIIRLILGREHLGDSEKNNKYTRAVKFLNNWLKKGVLKKDRKPYIYIYSQQYYHRREKRTRWGFIALMKIENFNKSSVLPHEHTFAAPKQDRLNLLKEVKANLSPVFSIFSDQKGRVSALIEKYCSQNQDCVNFEQDEVIHKLWRLSNKSMINKIISQMRNKQIFIADGHHRYEAAMDFYHQMLGRGDEHSNKYGYVMVYFVASAQGGLTILPTHRVIETLPRGLSKDKLKQRLSRYFKLTKFDNYADMLLSMEKEAGKSRLFGMYLGKDFYLLKLRNGEILDSVLARGQSSSGRIGKEMSSQWKKLDVAILHRLIVEQVLGIKDRPEKIVYTRDAQFAIAMVDRGGYKVAFFVNPAKVSQVKAIAGSGMRMPQKSTYFYPKVVSGLVINKF